VAGAQEGVPIRGDAKNYLMPDPGCHNGVMDIHTPPKQGDVLPGDVAIIEGKDALGGVHLVQARDLDHPFLGWFIPTNLYEALRQDVLTKDAFRTRYPNNGLGASAAGPSRPGRRAGKRHQQQP
jgi:hypothetical protein